MKFRKKPVVIEAVQWTGENGSEVQEFAGASSSLTPDGNLFIHTLEGNHHASVGNWIIRGIKGEFYPCKPNIFEATYELADRGIRCECPMCEHMSAREIVR